MFRAVLVLDFFGFETILVRADRRIEGVPLAHFG
jgi:hypothetical protein